MFNQVVGFLSFLILVVGLDFTSNFGHASPMLSLSPKASALGNAVTADPAGLSAISFNPATLSKIQTGNKGRFKEYSVLFAPFPDYAIQSSKPTPENDPYNFRNTGKLIVNDLQNTDLFQGRDPREKGWEPKIDKLLIYIPGMDEIEIDDSALNYILLPLMTTAYRPSSNRKLTFTTSFLPGGGGVKLLREDWMLRDNLMAFGIIGYSPTIAYEITPRLSLGATLTVQKAATKLAMDFRQMGLLLPLMDATIDSGCSLPVIENSLTCSPDFSGLDVTSTLFHIYFETESDVDVTYNWGLLWEPTQWLTLGLAFDPGTQFNMRGHGGIDLNPGYIQIINEINADTRGTINSIFGGKIVENYTGQIALRVPVPKTISTGLSVLMTPRLRINIDYHWRRSSDLNKLGFFINAAEPSSAQGMLSFLLPIFTHEFDLGDYPKSIIVGEQDLGFKFKDVGNFALGLSFQYSNRLTLRTGFEKKGSAVVSQIPTGLPTDTITSTGMGISYKVDKNSTMDLSYVNLKMEGKAKAGDTLLTSINPYYAGVALWAGMDLFTRINADIIQLSFSKAY